MNFYEFILMKLKNSFKVCADMARALACHHMFVCVCAIWHMCSAHMAHMLATCH